MPGGVVVRVVDDHLCIDPQFKTAIHDFRAEGLDANRLDGWVGKVGWEKLLNKASTTFRELADKDKQGLDEKKAKALMLVKPTMVKRPVLEVGDRVLVGFKPEVYEQAVGK